MGFESLKFLDSDFFPSLQMNEQLFPAEWQG
jgi:hypothetical protein